MAKLSSHTLRTISMPVGMVIGALLCRQIVALDSWSGGYLTPILIFAMLFFTGIGLFFKAFHIFLAKKYGGLQLFVYLCTLELIPLLLVGKALVQYL